MENKTNTLTPMRIVFCACPGIYSSIVLRELVASPVMQLAGIVESTRIIRKNGWFLRDILQLVRRSGIRYATYLWLVTSLYSLLARIRGSDPVAACLKHKKIPVLRTRDINNSESKAFVQGCKPDILLSAYFNQLVGPDLLALPPHGCVNIHPGKLPEFKGVDPVFHALLRGAEQVGVTVHLQDQGFDTGPVLISGFLPVQGDDTLMSLNSKLFHLGIRRLLDMITTNGRLPESSPQHQSDDYDSWPAASAVRRIRKTGRKLVDIRFLSGRI